ncbi:MAG: Cys-tRNA(Pro) deacylase [Lachnospiraceae bacterium]|nr:Cys-tRNA(Pro) deacylase [Lachnospiraceae bacterium]
MLKNKEEKTNAIRLLEQKKLNFKVHDYSQSDVISGLDVANYLKENPDRVFKTLVTIGKSGSHYVFLVPVNKELNLKKAAQSVSEKNISMIKSKELLPLTGYIHGGCSPIGMKKFFTTIIDASAKDFDEIIFSAGKIGFQIEMNLTDLEKIIKFKFDEITI